MSAPVSTARLSRLKTAAAAFIAAVFCALAAGCSNNPYPPGESSQNVRYVGWSEEVGTLDPTVAYQNVNMEVISSLYPCFFKYDHLRTRPYVLDLNLGNGEPKRERASFAITDTKTGKAARIDGEQWTFRVRKGLRFQDDPCFPGGKGRQITAADFVYSWRRMADPHLNCPILSFVQDKVLGMDALVRRNGERIQQGLTADYAYPLPGVEVDAGDPYTFRIRLAKPYPQLRYLMAMQFTTPIAREAVARYGDEFARHPVGCGTFRMIEYKPHQRITLERNPNAAPETYPSEGDPGDREAGLLRDSGRRLPLLDRIVYVWTKEGVTGWNLFQQGYLDSYGVTPDDYNQVLQNVGKLTPEMERKGIQMRRAATPATYYFVFNMRDPVWGGMTPRARKLREAVSLCIDREQWISVTTQGLGRPAQFMLPPGTFGYDEAYQNPYCRRDIEKAKRLIAEAGYPGGIDPRTGDRLTLPVDLSEGGSAGVQQALLLRQWIEASGIRLDIQVWQSVIWRQRIRTGKATFFTYSWFADYPDPENFLQLLYGPNSGGVNYAAYNNPEYNRLFEQMSVMDDGPERLAVIRRMRAIVEEECVWIPFYHPEAIGITYPWLRNEKPHGMAYDPVRYSAVDAARRAAFQTENNRPNFLPIIVAVALIAAAIVPAGATINARRGRSVRRNVFAGEDGELANSRDADVDIEALASEKKAGT